MAAMKSFAVLVILVAVASGCSNLEWFSAARSGDDAMAIPCMNEHGVNLDARDEAGCTAVVVATINKHPNFVRTLLSRGADVNAQCQSGLNALMYAARVGARDLVKILVEDGRADEFRTSNTDQIAAGLAGRAGHIDILRYLLRLGAPHQLAQRWSGTALMWSAAMGEPNVLAQLMSHEGTHVEAVDSHGNTALMWAARQGNVKNIIELTRLGANLQTRNRFEWTLLHGAAAGGHAAALAFLLDKGLDVNAVDRLGWTPIMYAALNDQTEAIEMLLNHYAATHPVRGGLTPLMIAAAAGNPRAVDSLLSRGLSPFHTSEEGHTALSFAEQNNHQNLVALLTRIRSARDLHNLHVQSHEAGDL
eukprot:m.246984 g.246984  ORF g.246984 m.246984 type:complete len:362 (-) comp46978_c0_seq1:126-1211(-)